MHHYFSQPNRNTITEYGINAACMHTLRRHMHRQAGSNCTDAKLYFWTIFQLKKKIQMGPGPTHPIPNYFGIFGIFLTLQSPLLVHEEIVRKNEENNAKQTMVVEVRGSPRKKGRSRMMCMDNNWHDMNKCSLKEGDREYGRGWYRTPTKHTSWAREKKKKRTRRWCWI